MVHEKTHYGDEDPEFVDHDNDPEFEEELFEIAKHAGHEPSDMGDKAFADRYAKWLERHQDR